MIKVRATPFLKALGFRYSKLLDVYIKDMTHGARVYKEGHLKYGKINMTALESSWEGH